MSTLSDVLPPSSTKDALSAPPAPKQGALDRLKRRMENYRDMQNTRLPQYDQTMNQVNTQQLQETKVLRQKFLESKAKKPSKKSSSSSEKVKQEINAMNNMNGMMQFHAHNSSSLGQPGPQGHPGLGPGHPGHAMNHTGSQPHMMHHSSMPQKRPLDEDTKNTPDTAKRLNLDNGISSEGSHNSVKREPSPVESKCQPGAAAFSSNSVQNNNSSSNNSATNNSESCTDVKPNLNIKTEDTSLEFGNSQSIHEEADSKIKSEVDSLKQEDTLGDLDLKDFDGFDGMNTDAFQDLMDDLPEFDKNFYETLDFDDNKNGEDVEGEEKVQEAPETVPSSQNQCHTPPTSQSNPVSSMSMMPGVSNGSNTAQQPNAAEALKMMAQQHQQPNMGMEGPPSSMPGQYPGQMYSDRNYTVPNSAMDPRACPTSGMNTTMAPSPGMMIRPRMQDGDPRLRAAVQQRFRLGNPMSVANSIPGAGSNMAVSASMQGGGQPLTDQQRMEMMQRSNPNMMMGGGPNPGMGPGMSMMGQQQVLNHKIIKSYLPKPTSTPLFPKKIKHSPRLSYSNDLFKKDFCWGGGRGLLFFLQCSRYSISRIFNFLYKIFSPKFVFI